MAQDKHFSDRSITLMISSMAWLQSCKGTFVLEMGYESKFRGEEVAVNKGCFQI